MKIAHIDNNNKLLGWYDSDIHSNIPEPNIQVTDEQWQNALDNAHNTVMPDGSTSFVDYRTEEDLLLEKVEDAKRYLAETDYKVLPDYDGDTTGILEARAEARALIRSVEG